MFLFVRRFAEWMGDKEKQDNTCRQESSIRKQNEYANVLVFSQVVFITRWRVLLPVLGTQIQMWPSIGGLTVQRVNGMRSRLVSAQRDLVGLMECLLLARNSKK